MKTLKPQTLLILNAVLLIAIFAAIIVIFWQRNPSQADTKYPTISDFALLDQEGKFHKLSRYANSRGVVLYVYGVGCPIARNHLPALKKLRDEYKKGVSNFYYWIAIFKMTGKRSNKMLWNGTSIFQSLKTMVNS